MLHLNTRRIVQNYVFLLLSVALTVSSFAQHRGDNLSFQGLDLVNRNGVEAMAMGGAYTARSGELDALFWNPAGLIGINGLQVTANFHSNDNLWRERQDYRPNRQAVTMSFILDGLYTPNPAFNGWLDNEAFFADSTYIIAEPELGVDSYSEEGADWQKQLDDAGLNNIAAAFPFAVAGKQFVAAAGYSGHQMVTNYDRNETLLTPHPAFDGYGDLPGRVTAAGDTVIITWSDYERQRTGPLGTISAALAFAWNDRLHFSLGFNRLSGETDDMQSVSRIGQFALVDGIQIFRFNYDTLDVMMTGTSDFSATSLKIGAQMKFGQLTLGANLTPGYTITRDWNYTMTTATADSSGSQDISGQDELKIPASFSVGASIQPHKKFRMALDYEHRPYADAEFTFNRSDASHRDWLDQSTYRFGIQYMPIERLSLLAGYRNVPQIYAPDGAANPEKGPQAELYSLGASLRVAFVSVHAAWETSRMKYYDVYYSNTNFAFEKTNNFLFGISYGR